jgi:hypothetical protein
MKDEKSHRKRRLLALAQQPAPAPSSEDVPDRDEATASRRASDGDCLVVVEEPVERFFSACGGRQPVELAVSGPRWRANRPFPFQRPFLLIGRSRQCDIQLPHPDVSFRHAYLQWVGGRLLAIDLNSRTGTCWNSVPRLSGWVTPDHELAIGPYSVRFVHPAPPAADSHDPPESSVVLAGPSDHAGYERPDVTLEIKTGRDVGKSRTRA